MPLTCSHCGAENPDGMQFCQSCGSPLTPTPVAPEPTIPAASPPPPATPEPPPAPAPVRRAVYQNAPVHRLPLGSLIGIVIGVLGLVAAIGILTSHRSAATPPPLPVPTALPTSPAVQPTFAPQPTAPASQPTSPAQPTQPLGQPTQPAAPPTFAPQPTQPAAPPTFAAQPTAPAPQPTGPPGPGQTFASTTFSVFIPSEWQVINQSTKPSQNEVILQDPSTAPNGLDIFAGLSSAQTDAQTVLQTVLTNLQRQYPDAQQCGSSVPATFGGVAGTLMPVCYTITPQGGAAISVAELAWAATDAAGVTVYFVGQTAAQSNQPFFTHAGDVTKTIHWGGSQ